MKTVGLLGGMSWESTREYYRIINEQVRGAKGGLHSAPLLLHSFDFAPIAAQQKAGNWDALNLQLSQATKGLEQAGAEAILICTNYMHLCAESVQSAIHVPLLHIADCVAEAIKAQGQRCVGLVGALGTMEHPFYRERLQQHGIETVIPDDTGRAESHRLIFEELCLGRFTDEARRAYLAIMAELHEQGAEGVILGCTEIEQLFEGFSGDISLYPSAEIHAKAAADFILR